MGSRKNNEEDFLGGFLSIVLAILLPLIIIIGFLTLLDLRVKTAEKELKKAIEVYGTISGQVAEIKTWQADSFYKFKDDGFEFTINTKDRCKINFTDGRSKEFVGMPKEALPTDKEIEISYTIHDYFLEWEPINNKDTL